MDKRVSTEGILGFKALTLTKGVLKQIEKVCNNANGKLIGYVVDDYQMVTFIGEENGKLYSTRQDFMLETYAAWGRKDVTFFNLNEENIKLKATLPQIFVK